MIGSTPFIIVDIETTGLEPSLDRIIELAAVKVMNGQILGEWDSLVNPEVYVPQESTNITGITTEMVTKAPSFKQIAPEFLDFVGINDIFVAHNVDFDRAFLNNKLQKENLRIFEGPYLCTFKMAKRVHPNLYRYSLGALAEVFQIDLPIAHRAIHDARATAQLLIKFLRVLQDGGLKELKDIPGIQNVASLKNEEVRGQSVLF